MTSCIDHTQCDAGFRMLLDGTVVRNRECAPCINGTTFQPNSNQNECLPCRKCLTPNRYNETCVTTQDATCEIVDLGEGGGSGSQSAQRRRLSLQICNETQYTAEQRDQCLCDVVKSIGNTQWNLTGADEIWASCSVVCAL